MLVFEERLENRRTGEKPLGARTRTNNKARYLIAFRKRENTFFFRLPVRNVQVQVCLITSHKKSKIKVKKIYITEEVAWKP